MAKNHTFEALGLMHAEMDRSIRNIVTLAAQMLNAPMSLVSHVNYEKDRQFFFGHKGLPSELAEAAETTLDVSICKFVQSSGKTVAIRDTLKDARTINNAAIHNLGIRSYIGSPIHAPSGRPVGALCCMSSEPRDWTDKNIENLINLTVCIDDIIESRALALEERTAREKLYSMLQNRFQYISEISHEIRSPLTGIIGSIKILKSGINNFQSSNLIEILERSSNRLLNYTNNTLNLTKFEMGCHVVVEEPIDIVSICENVMMSNSHTADSKSITLKVCNLLSHECFDADEHLIETVLQNLVSNAIKFTDCGSVTIRLSEDSYGRVVIQVIDTGIGIPREYHETIFDEFDQGHPSTSKRYGGSGVGMTIVKRIIDAMDGSITLDSQQGVGTRIEIALPLSHSISSPSDTPDAVPCLTSSGALQR